MFLIAVLLFVFDIIFGYLFFYLRSDVPEDIAPF